MHYCSEEVYDAELEELSPHLRFYYDCLMKPNARSVLTALKKVKDLEFSTIATGHGPLLRYNVPEIVERWVFQISACSQRLSSWKYVCICIKVDSETSQRISLELLAAFVRSVSEP